MTEQIDWPGNANHRAAALHIARALRRGAVVALPTATGYSLAASALAVQAAARLRGTPGIAVSGVGEARDWVPTMSALGQRLARRLWPGPLILEFTSGQRTILASRLPPSVQESLSPYGSVRLHCPAHQGVRAIDRLVGGPLLLSDLEENVGGVEQQNVDLIVSDGPAQPGSQATVVRVGGNQWQLLRAGIVSNDDVRRQSGCLIVFLCTGNTCRSPLAEALCKSRLARRLECTVAELPERGYHVLSAGLSAHPGCPAAREAMTVARAHDADLSAHRSQPLTMDLAAAADYLVGMTQGHIDALHDRRLPLATQPRLLDAEGRDIADPIGYDLAVYEECGRQIGLGLDAFLDEFSLPGSDSTRSRGTAP